MHHNQLVLAGVLQWLSPDNRTSWDGIKAGIKSSFRESGGRYLKESTDGVWAERSDREIDKLVGQAMRSRENRLRRQGRLQGRLQGRPQRPMAVVVPDGYRANVDIRLGRGHGGEF